MLESFLFPVSMAAGGVLVSSPIIIHLINRMRFKRIRWAAMEFLLKSQKRNRRRLIIEQLILLLLRILLVLLIALIVARFVGLFFGPIQPQTSQHFILLDDTASMNDQWLENGELKVSFKEAKRLVVDEIARSAAKASKAQQLKLLTATQPEQVRFDQRLNDQSIKDLGSLLGSIDSTALHVNLIHGIKKARQLFEAVPQDQRILYIVSDFRQTDWSGPNGDKLIEALQELRKQDIHIKFVDVADPPRRQNEKDPAYHDNLAIVGLRPEARVTARNRLTEFTVTVFNYSLTERKNVQVRVKVNGVDRPDRSVVIPVVRAGEKADAKFYDYLDQLGVNQISANLDPEETGLLLDNTRFTVVEVRERVPILLIDGDAAGSEKEGGDAYFLNVMFNANRGVSSGYDLKKGTLSDLERPNLDQYPSIYLVNVRDLPNDKAVKGLQAYVEGGGNVAFFMGDRVNPEFYNRVLYKNGEGLFPVPLADRPSPELTPEEKDQRILANFSDPQYQIYLRSETHPILREVYPYKDVFKFLSIERYYPVPRSRWRPAPGKTEELVTLPNRQSVDDYKDITQDLLTRLQSVLDKQVNEKYRARFNFYRDSIRDVLSGKPLFRLANVIDAMLRDRGDTNKPDLPNLAEFWGQTDRDVEDLRSRFESLRDTVQFGDPLVVAGQFGKGRVLVWLTTIGRKWSNWAGDFPVSATFPVVMSETQKWLTAGTSEDSLIVGSTLVLSLDATRYEDKMRRIYRPESRDKAGQPEAKAEPGTQPGDVVMGPEQRAHSVSEGRVNFQFADANKPGVYILEFMPKTEEGASDKREQRGYAFNVDTAAESNLLRVDRNILLQKVDKSQFYTLGSDQFTELEQRQRDLSEGPWLFLAFLLILVLEQALAVHLSCHLKGHEAQLPMHVLKPAGSSA